jgi:hypothetical protein
MALFYVALDGPQSIAIMQDSTVRQQWFGQSGKWAMVPLKRSAETAHASHVIAVGEPPVCILRLTMPFHIFHEMVDSGVMVPCLHVNGYRVYQAIVLDTAGGWDWAVHPIALNSNSIHGMLM